MQVVSAEQGFPTRSHDSSVMELQRKTGKAEVLSLAPQTHQTSLGKTLQMLNTLCRVSWGQSLVVPVIIAQRECCAASLPVGTGARITSALS